MSLLSLIIHHPVSYGAEPRFHLGTPCGLANNELRLPTRHGCFFPSFFHFELREDFGLPRSDLSSGAGCRKTMACEGCHCFQGGKASQ